MDESFSEIGGRAHPQMQDAGQRIQVEVFVGGGNTNTGLAQMSTEPLGLFALASDGVAYSGNKTSEPDSFIFDAATVWGEHAGAEFAPVHVWQPVVLYLGRPA